MLTLCTVSLVAAPSLLRQFNVASPAESWTPPPPSPTIAARATPSTTVTTAGEPTATLTAATVATSYPTPEGPITFKIGDVARNVNSGPVNLRLTPGYRAKPTEDRLALVPARAQVEIVGGPIWVDDLTWWQVRWQGQEGWMAEQTASGVRILAPLGSP